MRLSLLLIAGCAATPHPHETTLQAPPNAVWTSATVVTGYAEHSFPNSMIGGTTTVADVKVQLVVRHGNDGSSTPLWDIPIDAFGFPEMMSADDIARVRFQLAASPDGRWLAISWDVGKTWIAVDPDSLMYCRHLGLTGAPATFWARIPDKKALALDIIAGKHGVESAEPWVIAHADEPATLPVVTAMLLATADNRDVVDDTLVATVKARLPRDQLLAALGTATTDHMRVGSLVAELLWTEPGTQAALANWTALAMNGPDAFSLTSDWMFARAVWDLARLVQRDGATPEAAKAAAAVIATASKGLPTAEERVRIERLGNVGHWWGHLRSVGAQAATAYAIQILVAAHDLGPIKAADFDRNAKPSVPPVRYRNPQRDWSGDVDAWFVWALGH